MAGPLATPHAWNLVAPGYVKHNQPAFDYYAAQALKLVEPRPEHRFVDVATGPGSLAVQASRLVRRVDALDFSEPMLVELRRRLSGCPRDNVFPVQGDGQSLPYESEQFDAAFSMFGLMFFPDRAAGFSQLYRVLKPGGRAVVSSWVPMDNLVALRTLFAALAEARGDEAAAQGPPPVLSTADAVRQEMTAAGFAVQVVELTYTWLTPTLGQFLTACRAGFAPLCLVREAVGDAAFEPLWARVGEKMAKVLGPGPVAMPMTALLGVGTK